MSLLFAKSSEHMAVSFLITAAVLKSPKFFSPDEHGSVHTKKVHHNWPTVWQGRYAAGHEEPLEQVHNEKRRETKASADLLASKDRGVQSDKYWNFREQPCEDLGAV